MSRRRPYMRPMAGWWRRNPFFVRYMLREGTSVLLAAYALVLLAGVWSLAEGRETYEAWLAAMGSPVSVVFHLAVLAASLYHSVTWFAVSPKTMPPIAIGGQKVPERLIVLGQYAGAVAASLVILIAVWSP